ncbi:MAG: GNAT family N-acetyltransferase [Caldilineaceae bacterium]
MTTQQPASSDEGPSTGAPATPPSEPSGITIAIATEADIPGIQLTAAESWRATYRAIYSTDFIEAFIGRAYSAESLRRVVGSKQSVMMVAHEEGSVVGFGHAGYGRHGGELYRIYLRPAWWGSGVGDLLLRHIELWLRDEGYLGYGCHVHRNNEVGQRFYAKHAFRHLREHDEGDNLFLWKDLF